MPLYTWLALLLVIVACVVGLALVAVRGLELWRTFKAFGRALEQAIGAVMSSVERLAASTERASAAPQRLEPVIARLQSDLARAAVLRAAMQDVRDSLGRLTAFYPSK
ncbi:MAG: hypothetical protein ACYDA3_13820 [Gaiellaceae bacterium]